MTIEKCPNCGTELVNYECINTEWASDTYYDTVTANCPYCGKAYVWTDIYKLQESIDIKEMKEDG